MRTHIRLVVLACLALAAGLSMQASAPASAQLLRLMPQNQADVISNLLPTVVNITAFVSDTSASSAMKAATATTDRDAAETKTQQGSGFIIDPSGVVLTNDHVIAGAYDIKVMLSDGTRLQGHLLAASPRIDLALIKVDTTRKLAPVHWADSDRVQVGEPVFAIGNPLGVGLSVTSGIVSALNRNIMDTPYDDYIQTDAAINHGNSGGPLFNRRGEVIGVDTAIISPTTGSSGLGFAIPSNDAQFCAMQLLRSGTVRPGYLGLTLEPVTQDIATALGQRTPLGSIVSDINADGPAALAGLRVGDVILRYNNTTPPDERALMRAIARSAIGHPLPLTILHDGVVRTVQVTPGDWPGSVTPDGAPTNQANQPAVVVPHNLGLSLSALTADLRAKFGLRMQQQGVLVDGVAAGTDAFERKLAPGDVILKVQDTNVNSAQAVQSAVDAARAENRRFILALVLPKQPQTRGPRWVALKV